MICRGFINLQCDLARFKFYTIKKLSKRLNPTNENLSKYLEDKTATQKELNEANFSDAVPISVTEKTTRQLKVKNKSTQSKHQPDRTV